MTTVSRFSRENDAGLRAPNIFLWGDLVLVVVLVLDSKASKWNVLNDILWKFLFGGLLWIRRDFSVSNKYPSIAWRTKDLLRNIHDKKERTLSRNEMAGFSTRRSIVVFITFSPNWKYYPILRTRNSTKGFRVWKNCVCNELHDIVDGKSSTCDLSTVATRGDRPDFYFAPVCEGICEDFYFPFSHFVPIQLGREFSVNFSDDLQQWK